MKILIISLSLLVIFTLCASQESLKNSPDQCDKYVRCSSKENPVWTTTDGKSCYVVRNKCFLMTDNCKRVRNNQTEARDIGQEKCQKLCKTSCASDANTKPICGDYNGQKQNFGSLCEMENLNCATGKTFSLFSEGSCPL